MKLSFEQLLPRQLTLEIAPSLHGRAEEAAIAGVAMVCLASVVTSLLAPPLAITAPVVHYLNSYTGENMKIDTIALIYILALLTWTCTLTSIAICFKTVNALRYETDPSSKIYKYLKGFCQCYT